MGLVIAEVPYGRETFGGDGRAINRHSVRLYTASDSASLEFTLDRTLDGVPPFFTLWQHYTDARPFVPQLGRCIQVDGKDYWGDGWTWDAAEEAALAALADLHERQGETKS